MKKNYIVRILYIILAFVSFGFYVHPLCAFENPANPRNSKDIVANDDKKNPGNKYERISLDEIDPDNAPHSEKDRKNWAQKS